MAERRDDPQLYWVSPEMRGVIPLDDFHVPHRLARTVRSGRFTITSDRAFADVMQGCAAPGDGREQTWINDEILRLYTALAASGHAHSVECWQEGKLVGGLYGVQLGAAFFGESMFSLARDASKVALVRLVELLRRGGFILLDTQFLTAHLARFGATEVPRERYLKLLENALSREAVWAEIHKRLAADFERTEQILAFVNLPGPAQAILCASGSLTSAFRQHRRRLFIGGIRRLHFDRALAATEAGDGASPPRQSITQTS